MGKRPKPEEEIQNGNDSSDIFRALFGRGAAEEPGLGLGQEYVPNPKNKSHGEETNPEDLKPKNRNRENGKKSDFDATEPGRTDESPEGARRKKKSKEKSRSVDAEVESVVENEVKKRKENEREQSVVVGLNKEKNEKDKKKKKRKRTEIEEEYEARTYGVEAEEEGAVAKRVVGEKRKTVDDPAEMMISKEGFDDENKLLRTVFVGNLPLKMKKKALLKEFSKFGEIESARIRSVPLVDSKTPRKGAIFKGKINESIDSVHAYIVFKDEKAAQASLSHNMAMVGANHVRVDMACPPRKKLKGEDAALYDNKRTVFVGNLPFDVKDEEIYQLFCRISQLQSNIEAVRVIRDPHTSIGKGIAYVLFKTRDAANLAIKNKHLKLRDRDLRLYHARADSMPSKEKRPMPASEYKTPTKRLALSSTHPAKNKKEARGTLSYQGLQASKSGVQKKEFFHKRTGEQGKRVSGTGNGTEGRQRKSKRPAVAARKANALKGVAGPGKQAGKKRRLESGTPESSHMNKKARKSR